jgi:diacylglycerol kinase family enzyme
MRSRVAVILNPGSGPRRHSAQEIAALFQELGMEPDIRVVEDGGAVEGEARALLAEGHTTLFAAGGDGTVAAAAAALAGTPCVLGVLPTGTLNHLARDLGIPASLPQAARLLAAAGERRIDVGEVNGRLFVNTVSLGLYPAFVQVRGHTRRLPRVRKVLRGAWAVLVLIVRFPLLRARIVADGRTLRRRTPVILIGNNPHEIDGPRLGTRATLDAGVLSLLITHRTGPWGVIAQFARAARGTLRGSRDMDVITARRIEVRTSHRHVHAAVDGEVVDMTSPLVCTVRCGALRVLAPPVPDGPAQARPGRATLRA